MLTTEQRQLRKQFLTASEMAAICGVDEYTTLADVWAKKRGLVPDAPPNAAMMRGSFLEVGVLDWAQELLPRFFIRDLMMIDEGGILAANFDGIDGNVAYGKPAEFAVEAKTSRIQDGWGEPGSDDVPERVKIQTHAQMAVAGPTCAVVYVPALIAMELVMYEVPRDESLIDAIRARADWFVREILPRDEPPEGGVFSPEVAQVLRRVDGKVVSVEPAIIDELVAAKADAKAAKEREDAARGRLLAAMADGEIARADGMDVEFTYKTTKRAGYTVEPTEFRQLRQRKVRA